MSKAHDAALDKLGALVERAQEMWEELAETDPAAAEAFVELVREAMVEARAGTDARALIERVRRSR